jgi:PadR family transcriptional regulator PadR
MTPATEAVVGALLAADGELFGMELVRACGLGAGTVYPILRRLAAEGWVTARWEAREEAQAAARPARRYYELTSRGRAQAVHRLAAERPSAPVFEARWAQGQGT